MSMVLIAIIGSDDDAGEVLFKGFSSYRPDRVYLLVKDGSDENLTEILKNLKLLGISWEIRKISNSLNIEEVFVEIKKITDVNLDNQVVINVDCDYYTSCFALSSAFVNGITAIGIVEDELIVYPIMKFSYFNLINEKKMGILKIIGERSIVRSMEELAKLSKMSLPLIAYHLKGNRDSVGLLGLNLVSMERVSGSFNIRLTELGKLLIKGAFNDKKNFCR